MSQFKPFLLLSLVLLPTRASVFCQNPSATGIVNIYTPVVDFGCDSSELVVSSAAGFFHDDKVLIIQMKGAIIDTSNTMAFGSLINLKSAGNYEFNRVHAINGDHIQLKNSLLRSYELTGLVQLIRVPEYESLNANDLTCLPWNGLTGGVLVLDVKGTLTLSGQVDVSGKGFRGGAYINAASTPCHYTDYFYPPDPELSAEKGEGIAIIGENKSFGRGKLANGGGGGNAHNGGGGGGGNYGAGGHGGYEYPCTGPLSQQTNGIAGLGLDQGYQMNRIYLGGGGGAGHSNDGKGTKGGNGGGIVILIAGQIMGQSVILRANGEDILGGNANNDGQGGGGAGGTVVLASGNLGGSIQIEANGGRGGNSIFLNQLIGPGGGGSGGVCMTNSALGSITISVTGGNHGVCAAGAHGAQNGFSGQTLGLPLLPESTIPAPVFNIPLELELVYPCGQDSTGSILVTPLGLDYSLNGYPFQTTPIFSNLVADHYTLTIKTQTGCKRDTVVTLKALEEKVVVQTIELCPGNTVILEGNIYDTPQIVSGDTLQTAAGCDSVNIYEIIQVLMYNKRDTIKICPNTTFNYKGANYSVPAQITDTLPSLLSCDTLLTITPQALPYPAGSRTLTLCPGQSVTIGGTRYTTPGTAVDTIPGAGEDCDTIRTTFLVFEPPTPPFLPADTFLCEGDVLEVSSPYANMRWNGQPGLARYTIREPGVYMAAGETPAGCPARDTIRVRACCDGQNLYVPNAFSPNDDGFNDYFRAFPGIEWCQNYLLQVYDRWGELLYQENTPPLGWDGAFRGREMPGGIYLWVIEIFSEKTGQSEILKGDVLLVR